MSPLPVRPPPDRNAEAHEAYIDKEAARYAAAEGDYIDRVLARLLELSSFWWLGTATAVNASAKTVTVRLDALAGRGGKPAPSTGEFKFGRQSWVAGAIVGKRVRVGWNPILNYGWIIDTVSNE